MKDIRTVHLLAMLAALAAGGRLAPPLVADEQPAPLRLETKHISDDNRVRLEVGPGRGNTLKVVPFEEDAEQPAATSSTQPGGAAARERAPASAARGRRPVAHPAIDVGGEEPRVEQTMMDADGAEPGADDIQSTGDSDVVLRPPHAARPAQAVQRLPATALEPKHDFQPRFRAPAVRQAQHLEPAVEESASDDAIGAEPESQPASQPVGPAQPVAPGKAALEEAYGKSKTAATDSDYTAIIELCRRASDEGLKTNHAQYSKQLMSWAYNRRGEARIGEGREKEALADFEASAELNPQSWRAIHNRGVSYASTNRTDEAIADFERTIELNPKYANAHFNLGELRYQQDKFDEAIGHYTAAIDLGPPDAAMFSSRGHALYRLRRFGDALRDYSQALEVDPRYAPALVNRGDAYLDVGRYADAAADYRAAIEADPSFGRAYQAASWLMATCPDEHYRNTELALEAAKKALELDGENHRTLETLAAAQANSGMFAEAKESQERAIAAVPRDQLVAAEKRMALYQRDLAYREVSQQQMVVRGERRKQEEADGKSSSAVQQATAELPNSQTGRASFPEAHLSGPGPQRGTSQGRASQGRPLQGSQSLGPPSQREPYADAAGGAAPAVAPKRSFWPQQLNPFKPVEPSGRRQSQARPRNLPKSPKGPSSAQAIRPF